jgi:hypothetical protein
MYMHGEPLHERGGLGDVLKIDVVNGRMHDVSGANPKWVPLPDFSLSWAGFPCTDASRLNVHQSQNRI